MERRRLADRERILREAAIRFAEVGPERVRLDEIAEAADVARGTLYSHFPSKEVLVQELMRPVFEDALAELPRAERARTARERITGLLEVYLVLWKRHADALRLSQRMIESGDHTGTAGLHVEFVMRAVALFAGAARANILRTPSPELAGRTLARVAIPLLELYAPQPDGDALFVQAMQGLLVRG